MGSFFTTNATKQDIIKECLETRSGKQGTAVAIAHKVHGNELWTVWEVTNSNFGNLLVPQTMRYIGMDLLIPDKTGWGYKPMCEEAGPYFYGCPLSFLDMVPHVANQQWRDDLRKHHAERNAHRLLTPTLKVGDVVQLKEGRTPNTLKLLRKWKRSWIAEANGQEYRVASSLIAEVL